MPRYVCNRCHCKPCCCPPRRKRASGSLERMVSRLDEARRWLEDTSGLLRDAPIEETRHGIHEAHRIITDVRHEIAANAKAHT